MTKKKNILSAMILAGAMLTPVTNVSAFEGGYGGNIEPFTVTEDSVIELDGVIIDARGMRRTAGIEINPGVTLTLKLKGDNYIYGGSCAAGIHVSPAYDAQTDDPNTPNPDDTYNATNSAKLIIVGGGSLTVVGGQGTANRDEYEGSWDGDEHFYTDEDNLPIWCGGAAGIGGNGGFSSYGNDGHIVDWHYGPDFGTITFDESFTGSVTARTSANLRYASSSYGTNREGNIDEYGGGAGIGSGGTVGTYHAPTRHTNIYGTININGGTIDASGHADGDEEYSQAGAGIGAGGAIQTNGDSQPHNDITVNITNGNVTAYGGMYAAGIGGGANTTSGYINISGGNVSAIAGRGPNEDGDPTFATGAGIGSGEESSIDDINITGGTVYAESDAGAAIGSGEKYIFGTAVYSADDNHPYFYGNINISGANTTVTAVTKGYTKYGETNSGAAIGTGDMGLGAYYNGWLDAAININITDHATVYAFGGENANGIGSGGDADVDNEDINEVGTSTGVAVTLDDTINLFAASKNGRVPAISTITNVTGLWYDETPLTFDSSDSYLVQRRGDTVTANKGYKPSYYSYCTSDDNDVCNTDIDAWTVGINDAPTDTVSATYALSGTTMTVTIDGSEESTTHEATNRFSANDSFALISRRASTTPDDPDTPEEPSAPEEIPETPATADELTILASAFFAATTLFGLILSLNRARK